MNIWKRSTLVTAALSVICFAVLLFTDISFSFSPSILTYSLPSGEQTTAEFYPAQSNKPSTDTAFLIATGENTSEKAILEGLLAINAPVMICRFPEGSPGLKANALEIQASLLASQTGMKESQLVLIGIHDGGTALLDEIILGTRQYKALALIAPEITSSHIDEGTIVDGNYLNESEWINALVPDMIRQPTALFSSSSDNLTSSYNMTLIYNKLSGDEIIHVGGVYQANRGDLSLNILDGGFHPTSPFHPTIVKRLFSFINDIDPNLGLTYEFPISARNWLKIGLGVAVFAFIICISQLTKYNLSEVSYGVSSSIRLGSPVRFFAAKGVSWLITIPVVFLFLPLFRQIFPGNSPTLPLIFSVILFSFSLVRIFVRILFKLPKTNLFKPISVQIARFAYGIGYGLIIIFILLVIPFSGHTFTFPANQDWIFLLLSTVISFPWFFFYLGEEEQIKDYKSGNITKVAYYLFSFLPIALFALVYTIFYGSTAGFACYIILVLLIGSALLGKGIFQISGSTFLSGLLSAFSLQITMLAFAGFQT